ncbi:MAG: hypothetical protein ACTSO2_19540 [Promethearchaeota archaeon]
MDKDVYFAPTCGFTTWICPQCDYELDLYEYTGISYEDASNAKEIEKLVQEFIKKGE